MTTRTRKKIALLSVLALGLGIGISVAAVRLGEQMQKFPPFDKIGLLIKITE